jgi:undecaprenyl-diphosphatase
MSPLAQSGDNGTVFDGSWYLDVTDFARHTHWLNAFASVFTDYAIGVFAVLWLVAWWFARRAGHAAMAVVIGAAVTTAIAVAINILIKAFVAEARPCRTYPRSFTVQGCPGATDYSFPSNHSVIAAAAAVGILLAGRAAAVRWLGAIAITTALLMALSRVYVGMHYPHDVAVGLFVGAAVSLIGFWLLLAPLTRLVGALAAVTGLRPLLATASAQIALHAADGAPKSADDSTPAEGSSADGGALSM